MPWAVIEPCINRTTFEYGAGDTAVKHFEGRTGHKWNSLSDSPISTLECPSCRRPLPVQWTRWDSQDVWTQESHGESVATGLADKLFEAVCECGIVIDHEMLKIQKFRKDIQALHNLDVPMPGTLFSHTGSYPFVLAKRYLDTHAILGVVDTHHLDVSLFPNRLIDGPSKSLYTKLELLTFPQHSRTDRKEMTGIRTEIESFLKDRAYVRKANRRISHALKMDEKIAIRRMMSRYWENSSPFALDLVGAVIRQCSFIEKMHSINWIHSPAPISTMAHLIQKYTRYIDIIALHPSNTAVPTLDVDLAWHTHQLSPPFYYAYTVEKTARFIDHDDKIEETALSTAFEWTSKTYQKTYHELYSQCTCWYCEAIRESHTSSVKRALGGNSAIEFQLDSLYAVDWDPKSSAHISTHNAIKADKDADRRIREINMKAKLERDYQKACNHARKKGRPLPTRDNYNGTNGSTWAMAYGYPIYMPYYSPYMGDPCVNDG